MRKLTYIIIALIMLGSCQEYSDGIYEGPDQVGWGKAYQGSLNKYIEDVATGDDDLDSLEIQLIGRHSSSAISVNFTVAESSTAIEGVHFDFVTTGGSVSIAPNTSSAYVYFNAKSDNFSIEEDFNLVLEITSADVAIAPNLATVSHNMSITCASELAGDYTAVSQLGGAGVDICGDGADYGPRADVDGGTVTLIATSTIGIYDIVSNACFGAMETYYSNGCGYVGLADFESAQLTDVCGDISGSILSAYNAFDIISDPISVSGSVEVSGAITITWVDHFGSSNTTVLTPAL